MTSNSMQSLFRVAKSDYEGSYLSDLLQQYKLYVQSAENVSARRLASSRYLLTLNAALVAVYGVQGIAFTSSYWIILVPAAGVLASQLWRLIIKSHRDLNALKFKIVKELEERLPAAPFAYEWQLVERSNGKTYNPVTSIEKWIPQAFLILHAVFALVLLSDFLMT